jgi:ribonuclease-3
VPTPPAAPSTCRTAPAAPAVSTAPAAPFARSSETRATTLNYAPLRTALGEPTLDPELLERALTHRSYAYEHGGLPTNERLEFLGDSVLGVVVTETLYRVHPDLSEGHLAKLRAAVVNARALAVVGRAIELGSYIKLGRGEDTTGGREKASILSDTVEAVIGAVHLSGGLESSALVVHLLFDPLMEAASALGAGLDWKTSLQELSAEHGLGVPEYLIADEGPDHMKTFTAQVRVGDQRYGNGVGRSKKEAEQAAAETAYGELATSLGVGDPAAVTPVVETADADDLADQVVESTDD